MPLRLAAVLTSLLACLAVVVGPAPAAEARTCDRVVNPYAGTRYEGTDLRRIRATGTSCSTARRVARGAHRKALGMTPTASGLRTFRWRAWTVTGDVRGDSDTYRARRGDRRVRWVF